MYPLFAGNDVDRVITRASPGTELGLAERVRSIALFLIESPLLVLWLPALFAMMARRWVLLWFYVAAVLTCALTVFVYPLDFENQRRFCVPLALAPALVGLDLMLRQAARSVTARNIALCCVGLGAVLGLGLSPLDQWSRQWTGLTDALHGQPPALPPDQQSRYAAMQAAIPPHARVVVAVDFPTLLNFSRNRIDCIDLPGAAAVGHYPLGEGPQALRQFLLNQGEAYLAFSDFETSTDFYSADHWRASLRQGVGAAWPILNFEANVESLARTQPLFYNTDGFRVVRLTNPH